MSLNIPDHCGLRLIYDQIPNGLALLVCPALELQPVAVGHKSAAPLTILYHLAVAGSHTDCGFLTFAGSLPEANVVQELVHVVIKPLFSLPRAPDLDALLHEPLHHEGRFIIPPTETVEHKNEQHIELVLCCSFLDFHDRVPVCGADLVPGDTLLRYLIDDLPVRMRFCVLPAGQSLHWDVIVIHLTNRRHPVKANDFFHSFSSPCP